MRQELTILIEIVRRNDEGDPQQETDCAEPPTIAILPGRAEERHTQG